MFDAQWEIMQFVLWALKTFKRNPYKPSKHDFVLRPWGVIILQFFDFTALTSICQELH